VTTSIALLAVGWCAGWWLLWRVPRLRDDVGPVDADLAVVIPARNEEANLPALLDDLAAQELAPSQVVVVDDSSTDRTADVAIAHGATVVAAPPLPSGWTGKAWSCQTGAAATQSERIVFLDADVRLRPPALGALVAVHDRFGGLVSVAPHHEMRRTYERLSVPFNIVSFMGVGAAMPGRRGRSEGVFGPCLVTSRADYEQVGGHASVRASVVDDLALARRYEEHGLDTRTYAGRGSVSYRMYPNGLRQLVEGWSKNMASGARFVSALRSLLIALWVTALCVTVQLVVSAMLGAGRPTVDLAVAAYGAFGVQWFVLARRLTNAGAFTAIVFPATTVFFVAMFLRSAWCTFVRRRVRWRGRAIDLDASGRPDRASRTH
jgi:4,4'-diaponeurosporenoate glycosyltransferase